MTRNQVFEKFEKLFRFGKCSALVDVDFKKPFWVIFLKLKLLILGTSATVMIREIATSLLPGALIFIILNQNYNLLFYILILAVVLTVVFFMEFYWAAILLNKVNFVLHVSAQNFFLKTDPVNHYTRSSGQIISKIERGATSMSGMAEVTFVDLLPMLSSIFASLIPLYFFDFKIGFFFSIFLILSIFLMHILDYM